MEIFISSYIYKNFDIIIAFHSITFSSLSLFLYAFVDFELYKDVIFAATDTINGRIF